MVDVWKECSLLVGFQCRWVGGSVNEAWELWWRTVAEKKHKSLPLLVIWGIWMARNSAIFQEKASTPELTSALAVGLFNSFPEHVRAANQRRTMEVEIDRSVPWGFFDGAAQNNACGGGAILYLAENHSFTLTMGLGQGTNNFAEIMSLKLLMIFALEKDCTSLSVFGDSLNVINWIRQTQDCRNIAIGNILAATRMVIQRFDSFSCKHVFRENNKEADKASKDGLSMAFGSWKIKELRDGQSTEFYHRPFIE